MRSELVFRAMTHVSNRFLLAKLAAAATRKLHRPNARIQETTDEVLTLFSEANPMAEVRNNDNVRLLHRAKDAGIDLRSSSRKRSAA